MEINASGQVVVPPFTTAGVVINNASGVISSTAGPLPTVSGGTGSSSFTASAFIYFNGTNLVNDIGITTDGSGDLTVTGNLVSNGGQQVWTAGEILTTAAGYALP